MFQGSPWISPERIRKIARFLLRELANSAEAQCMTDPWMDHVLNKPSRYSHGTVKYVREWREARYALEHVIVHAENDHIFQLEVENAVLKQKLSLYEKNHGLCVG